MSEIPMPTASIGALAAHPAPAARVGRFARSFPSPGAEGLAWLGLSALLVFLAFCRPIDHDESQYVTAAYLARTYPIYRAFDYLQTPLQPLIFAPLLGSLPALPLLRAVNAAISAGALLFLARTITILTGSRRAGWAGALLCLASEPFLFTAATARNDALPHLLLCGAVYVLAGLPGAGRREREFLSLALGFLVTAAGAAKISYALPAASIVLVELVAGRRTRWIAPGAFAAGALVTLAMAASAIVAAPMRALFDILVFPSEAPREWYLAHGGALAMSWPGRLLDLAKFLALGPALPLLAIIPRWLASEDALLSPLPARRWLIGHLAGLLVAGLIAAILPVPVWRQYLLPFYPALFVLGTAAALPLWRKKAWRAALGIFAVAGLAISGADIATSLAAGFPVMAFESDARLLGDQLRARHISGPVASMTPYYVVDAGGQPDARFAAGPFLFRTRDALGHDGAIVGVAQDDALSRLAARRPAAILIGGGETAAGSAELDAEFARIARSLGYRPVAPIGRHLTLWTPH